MSGRFSLPVTVILTVLVGFLAWQAFDFNEQARRLPLAVLAPTLIALVLQLVRDGVARRAGGDEASGSSVPLKVGADQQHDVGEDGGDETTGAAPQSTGPKVPETDEVMFEFDPKAGVLESFGWIALLGAVFYIFGLLLTVPIFMATFMRVYGGDRWRTIAILVASTLAVLYGFFVLLLEVRLYSGLVGGWIGL